jgi:hypothetical protein
MAVADQLWLDLAKRQLLSHFEGVCLIPDLTTPHRMFSLRFSMMDSLVFNSLPTRDAHIVCQLFIDFNYHTNIPRWSEQGDEKLSVLAGSTIQMLRYDINVALTDEEKDLYRIGICSYHVQRIPRDSTLRFDQTQTFLSLFICSPELPPLTQWWRNNQADAQLCFNQILKMEGLASQEIKSRIIQGIVKLHLASKLMWYILTMEDLFTLLEEMARLGDGKIAIDRLARESTK